MFSGNFFFTRNIYVLIAIALAYIIAIVLIWIFLRVKQQAKYKINLENIGNVHSYYYLSIQPTTEIIEYKLSYNGTELPTSEIPELVVEIPAEQTKDEKEALQKPSALQKREVKIDKTQIENAKKTGMKFAGAAGAVASILGIIGSILPGKLGNGLKAQSSKIRNIQSSTRSTMNAPRSAMNKANALKMESQKLGVSQTSGSIEAPQKESQTTIKPEKEKEVNIPTTFRSQTKELAPGEQISLDLIINKKKRRFPENNFLLTLTSQQTPLEHIETKITPIKKQINIHFKQIPNWRFWVTPLLSLIFTSIFGYFLFIQLTMVW